METQFITRMAGYEDRPAIIERLTTEEDIATTGFVADNNEQILEIAFFGTPLSSCNSYSEKKWLIQIYIRTEHHEFTGYANGRDEYNCAWTERYNTSYKMNEFLDPFVTPQSDDSDDDE